MQEITFAPIRRFKETQIQWWRPLRASFETKIAQSLRMLRNFQWICHVNRGRQIVYRYRHSKQSNRKRLLRILKSYRTLSTHDEPEIEISLSKSTSPNEGKSRISSWNRERGKRLQWMYNDCTWEWFERFVWSSFRFGSCFLFSLNDSFNVAVSLIFFLWFI